MPVRDFAQGAAGGAGHAYGVLAFFRHSCLIDDPHPLGLAHLVVAQAMLPLPHGRFVPERIAHEPRHRPPVAALHLPGHRFAGLAFAGTALPHQRVEKFTFPRIEW